MERAVAVVSIANSPLFFFFFKRKQGPREVLCQCLPLKVLLCPPSFTRFSSDPVFLFDEAAPPAQLCSRTDASADMSCSHGGLSYPCLDQNQITVAASLLNFVLAAAVSLCSIGLGTLFSLLFLAQFLIFDTWSLFCYVISVFAWWTHTFISI